MWTGRPGNHASLLAQKYAVAISGQGQVMVGLVFWEKGLQLLSFAWKHAMQ